MEFILNLRNVTLDLGKKSFCKSHYRPIINLESHDRIADPSLSLLPGGRRKSGEPNTNSGTLGQVASITSTSLPGSQFSVSNIKLQVSKGGGLEGVGIFY